MEANDWDNAKIALEMAVEKGHKKVRGKAARKMMVLEQIPDEAIRISTDGLKPGLYHLSIQGNKSYRRIIVIE